MNTSSKVKIALTSAVALGFAGITYVVLRKSLKEKTSSIARDNLNINLIISEKDSEDAVNELRRRSAQYHAIGFDCEWVADQGKRHPVALLQLSTYDGYCALFRLSHLKSIPSCLKDLLEDGNIYKVGVAPGDDAKYLANDYSIYSKSTLDIRHLVELCNYDPGGLATLSKALLGIILDKSWRIRCSNWEAEELTERQITYAALDAHVSVKMFVKLVNDYHKNPLFAFWRRNNSEHWDNISQFCSIYSDICYKTKQKVKKNDKECKEKESRGTREVLSKRYPHATRSKPLYHNCFLKAPDGELLCTCDNKKALWYVEKKLADVVCDEPLTVQLRFEPVGRSVGDVGRYYQLTKENRCVVCGASDSYIRKNVVPREYRKHFPEVMKEHSSHDVLLLCAACHQRSNARDQLVRERLAARCGAPLALGRARHSQDAACRKIRSAANALLYQTRKHALPEARRKELESVILQHYLQYDEITTELLEEAANIQVAFENEDYESHGSKVVEYYHRHEGLLRLEEEWREHFLASMRPRHMPALWSVTHNAERLRVRQNEGRLSEDDLKLIAM